MRIICETQEEYDNLMNASRYLHDFMIWPEDAKKMEQPIYLDQDRAKGMVGFLSHLYLSGRDFPNKDEVIQIQGEEWIELKMEIACQHCHGKAVRSPRAQLIQVNLKDPEILASSVENVVWYCEDCGKKTYSDWLPTVALREDD